MPSATNKETSSSPVSKTFQNRVSVVIPTYNEAGNIERVINHLKDVQSQYLLEVIVADGGSTDNTVKEAQDAGSKVILSPEKGRAAQMNAGAEMARGDIIYFLHADTFPPDNYDEQIVQAVSSSGPWGSFRVTFDCQHWFLAFVTWFTRNNSTFFRFGDQSLFVKRELFYSIGKFKPSQIIFEDTEIARRLRRYSKGRIVTTPVLSSARKFRENGVSRLCLIFISLWLLYMLGVSHNRLLSLYKKLIVQDKI